MKTFKQFLKESEEKELDEEVNKSEIFNLFRSINHANDSFHDFENDVKESLSKIVNIANNNNIDIDKEYKNVKDTLVKIQRLRERDLNMTLKTLTDKIQRLRERDLDMALKTLMDKHKI